MKPGVTALLGLFPMFSLAAVVQAQAANLVLEDAHGRQLTVRAEAPHHQLVILCSDREGARYGKRWLAEIRAVEPRPPLVEVAHLAGVPAVARPVVRRAFRGSSIVLLDWRGEIEHRYGFVPGHVNVYLIDRDGGLLLRTHGGESTADLSRFLAAMRTEASGPSEPPR